MHLATELSEALDPNEGADVEELHPVLSELSEDLVHQRINPLILHSSAPAVLPAPP